MARYGRNELHWWAARGGLEQESKREGVEAKRLESALLSAQDEDGDTPLHLALHYEKGDVAEHILRHCSDAYLAIPNHLGMTPLHEAILRRNERIMVEISNRTSDCDLQRDFGAGSALNLYIDELFAYGTGVLLHRIPKETLLAPYKEGDRLWVQIVHYGGSSDDVLIALFNCLHEEDLTSYRNDREGSLLEDIAHKEEVSLALLDMVEDKNRLLVRNGLGVTPPFYAIQRNAFPAALALLPYFSSSDLSRQDESTPSILHEFTHRCVTLGQEASMWRDPTAEIDHYACDDNDKMEVALCLLSELPEEEILSFDKSGLTVAHVAAAGKELWLVRLILSRLPPDRRDPCDKSGDIRLSSLCDVTVTQTKSAY